MHAPGRPVRSSPPVRPPRALRSRLLLLLLAGLVSSTLGACGVAESAVPSQTATAEDPGTPEATAEPTPAVTSVVVVGDSITAGAGPADRAENPGALSWLPSAQGSPLDFRGGWAVPGATTSDMLDNVMAYDADVVVVMGGTNDLTRGIDWSVSRANLVAIAGTVAADRVVLSAIPPLDAMPAAVLDYNRRSAELAALQGWDFTDPWTGVSQGGAFAPGTSTDGVHPTAEAAALAGQAIRAALLDGADD